MTSLALTPAILQTFLIDFRIVTNAYVLTCPPLITLTTMMSPMLPVLSVLTLILKISQHALFRSYVMPVQIVPMISMAIVRAFCCLALIGDFWKM